MPAKSEAISKSQVQSRLENSFRSFKAKMLASSDCERHTNYGICIGILSAMFSTDILREAEFDQRVETLGRDL